MTKPKRALSRPGVWTVLTLITICAHAAWAESPVNMIHGQPAFDSGWLVIDELPLQIDHDLGGDEDDYVIDLQFRDLSPAAANIGVHQYGIGGDFHGPSTSDKEGAAVTLVDTSTVIVMRQPADSVIGQVRVRIWLVPDPDYDSGWRTIDTGSILSLTHGLGGDADDYVVDLMMKDGSVLNMQSLGLDQYPAPSTTFCGAYWYALDETGVKVRRGIHDTTADQVRLRIFRRPLPSWDSGWRTLPQDQDLTLAHNLGGPWNDIYVDLQLDDTDGDLGRNNRAIGGDRHDASAAFGACWYDLTGSKITVHRFSNDTMADRIRIRLWATRAPTFDSGWRPIDPGAMLGLDHGLGGVTDDYVVDLEFKDTDGSFTSGIHVVGYGGDKMYDTALSAYDNRGASWRDLDSDSVNIFRLNADSGADEVRLRLWHAAPPDFDSGWLTIYQSQTLTLHHDVGGDESGYVVDLQFRSTGAGIHHISYGYDQFFEVATSGYEYAGAYWRNLTATDVKIRRMPHDDDVEQVRLRIWRDTPFSNAFDLIDAPVGLTTWDHGLGVNPDELVVSQTMRSDSATLQRHQYEFGGDRLDYGMIQYYGSWWEALTAHSVKLYRSLYDLHADDISIRLFWTGSADVLFADGFETGTTSMWSSGE